MDNVLVIGSGAREHAICRQLAHSETVAHVYCAPGNDGMSAAKITPVAISELDFAALAGFVAANDIAYTVVGPEDALCAGVVDYFQEHDLPIFGPNKTAAQLEGSKDFALRFMNEYAVPTAKFRTYTDSKAALAHVGDFGYPVVIKADGLAAGKGVTIAADEASATAAIERCFRAGEAQVVLEEYLEGPEYSLFLLVNGDHYQLLPLAQDHKRAFDADKGPNTGGMGAYSPLPQLSADQVKELEASVVAPTMQGLQGRNFNYHGVLYIGIVWTSAGPKVIEYNVRLGDPEAQVILPRLASDFAQVVKAIVHGHPLSTLKFTDDAVLTVVVAAQGYPTDPKHHGQVLPQLAELTDVWVDYANVKHSDAGLVGAGGRLLSVVATAETIAQAQAKAYAYLQKYEFTDCFYRSDIGAKALQSGK